MKTNVILLENFNVCRYLETKYSQFCKIMQIQNFMMLYIVA